MTEYGLRRTARLAVHLLHIQHIQEVPLIKRANGAARRIRTYRCEPHCFRHRTNSPPMSWQAQSSDSGRTEK